MGSLREFCGVSAGFCGGPWDFPRFSMGSDPILVTVGKYAPKICQIPCPSRWSLFWKLHRGHCGGGGGKQGRFVILRFPLFCSVWVFQDNQILGKTARKVSLSHPFLCVRPKC